MERPSLSCTEALHQAGDTVHTYLHRAVQMLDKLFGQGYAAANPGLVAECIRSQTLDFNCTAITAALYALTDGITEAGGELADAVREHAADSVAGLAHAPVLRQPEQAG